MKNILSIFTLASLFLLFSCEKNVITYDTTDVDLDKQALVRLIYDLPLVTSTAHNITKLTYNGQEYSRVGTALGSILPNSMGKYHAVPAGSVTVDAFKGAAMTDKAYSGTFTAEKKGRWNVFIYQENQPPLLVREPDSYPQGHPWNDTLTYIRFVNLFHKADGVTPYGKLTLKVERIVNGVAQWVDVASSGYKEASDYSPIKLDRKGIVVWSGTEASMKFALFDANGVQLQYFATTAATTKTAYQATGYSMTKGVHYIFHLNGKEGTNYAGQAIRLSTIAVH